MKSKFMWSVQVEAKKGEHTYPTTVVDKQEAERAAAAIPGAKVVRVKVYS